MPCHVIIRAKRSVDFTTTWYADVGTQLVLTAAANAVAYPGFTLLFFPLTAGLRWYTAPRALTQRDLDDALTGPEFGLAERYGQIWSQVFMALTLSAGLPLMLPCFIAYLAFTNIADKAFLLRLCRTPRAYGSELAGRLLGSLPWAVWLHLAVGFWMYGSLPSRGLPGVVSSSVAGVTAAAVSYAGSSLPAQFDGE